MSDNKKYYYMRLVENYFDRTELKIIRQMPKGAEYLLILLKMSCRSFAREGMLMVTDRIPYNDQTLAASLEEDINDVRAAMNVFVEFGLIEVLEGNVITINDIDKYIDKSSTEGDRKRIARRKQKAKQLENRTSGRTSSGQTSTHGQMSTIDRDYSYSLEIENRDRKIPRAPARTAFEPYIPPEKNYSAIWENSRKHWNKKSNLPEYKRALGNESDMKALLNFIAPYEQDEITAAIDNYSELLDSIECKYGTFKGFMRSGVDQFHDGANPYERFNKKSVALYDTLDQTGKSNYMKYLNANKREPESLDEIMEFADMINQEMDMEEIR